MACFAESLRDAISTPASGLQKLPMGFAVGLGLPFLLSIITAVLLWWLIPDGKSQEVPTELIFLNVLKISSVGVLAFHTQASVIEIQSPGDSAAQYDATDATKRYIWISMYMYIVALTLAIHTQHYYLLLLFVRMAIPFVARLRIVCSSC
jgi:hypothetical protein